MKRLLIALGLFAGLLCSALAVTPTTTVGNVAYTILSTDQRVATSVAFSAPRIWTLPSAGATCVGQTCPANALEVIDVAGAISVINTLTIAPASGETINGSTSSLTFAAPRGRVALIPTSGSNWSAQILPASTAQVGAASTVFHSGGVSAVAAATGTDATAVNTETYIVEVFIPVTTTITGVNWIGLGTSTGNVQFSLADAAGTVITAAQTASTATTTTANFQAAAFAAPYVAVGPAKYFVLMQNSGSNHYRAHTVGVFGAAKKTGETYGTFTNVTPPTTFTTAIAPIVDTY